MLDLLYKAVEHLDQVCVQGIVNQSHMADAAKYLMMLRDELLAQEKRPEEGTDEHDKDNR